MTNICNQSTANLRCVYCLDSRILNDDQVLIRGDHVYLAAPLGQMIEGYLTIAPYGCGSCNAQLHTSAISEIVQLKNIIRSFYCEQYYCEEVTFYEQGRTGGGALFDPASGFPLHAHLCALPVTCDLHGLLSPMFKRIRLNRFEDLTLVARGRPYLYTDVSNEQCLYVGDTEDTLRLLEQSRLKMDIARLLQIEERGDWRSYPGECELERLLVQFENFKQNSTTSGQEWLGDLV